MFSLSLPVSLNPYFNRALFLRECAYLSQDIGDYEGAAEYLNAAYRWESYGDSILLLIGCSLIFIPIFIFFGG